MINSVLSIFIYENAVYRIPCPINPVLLLDTLKNALRKLIEVTFVLLKGIKLYKFGVLVDKSGPFDKDLTFHLLLRNFFPKLINRY